MGKGQGFHRRSSRMSIYQATVDLVSFAEFNNDRACSHTAHVLLFISSTCYSLYFTLSYLMAPELHDHTFIRTKALDSLCRSPYSNVDTNHLDRRQSGSQADIEQG